MSEENEIKVNKYHRFVIRFLLEHGIAKSSYEIAKADDNNIDNDGKYMDALKDFENINQVIKDSEEWKINFNNQNISFLKDEQWKTIFSVNDELLDVVFANKKLTFWEWFNLFNKFSQDITNTYKNKPYELKKIARKFIKL